MRRILGMRIYQGTHRGALMGLPPTGKSVGIGGIGIYRLSGGKIVEEWVTRDLLVLPQQLGAVRAPE